MSESGPTATGKAGRPRTFDRAWATEQAMRVFWQHGFEGAHYEELSEAMGIGQSSLTNTFGGKEGLFREALAHYLNGPARWIAQTLAGGSDARSAFTALANAAAAGVTQENYPSGCMIAAAGAHVRPGLEAHQETLRAFRGEVRALMGARLRRGVAEGDLGSDVDIDALADFFEILIRGMALKARDGATREQLARTARLALAAWPDS